jgi:hypothetical protein
MTLRSQVRRRLRADIPQALTHFVEWLLVSRSRSLFERHSALFAYNRFRSSKRKAAPINGSYLNFDT